ncbi:uncharacterized protein LOC143361021 [Halictus rubicundus]|uniref:uncharacterized protein LOC143361021 n=1 Tax=Halictus rubicundus TaxID=77578 RepID=UPI004036C300
MNDLRQMEVELGISILPCGLFIDSVVPYLGATPDGLVQDDTIVEIKCPHSARDLNPDEAVEKIYAIRRIFQGDKMNKTDHYYHQVQGQLHITNRQNAIFCLWTPKGMKIIQVKRDDAYWAAEMEEKLKRFYEDYMLPEIIDSRFNRGQPFREPLRKHAAKNRVAKLEVHNQETQEQSIEDIPEKMDVAPTMNSDTDCFVAKSSTREETSEKSTIAELSIVDLRHIFEEMKKLENHSETLKCSMANLSITGMRRLGLATKILIECKMCKYKTEINSESAESDRLDINCSAVAGTITSGGGYMQMEEMFSAMNIPCMSRWIYRKCRDDIVETSINAAEAEMIAAAEEEKRLAIERGDVLPSRIPFCCGCNNWIPHAKSFICWSEEQDCNLQKDLTNIPSHVFGEHKECRRLGYFCDRIANNDEENMVPHLMEIGIYYKIQDIFRPLIAHAESLLYNSNNNSVESFNSIIAKYTGGKRINWSQRGSYTARCAAAVIQYNTKEVLSRIMRAKRKEPPKCLEAMEKRSKEENEKRNKKRKCSSQKARKPFSQTTRDKDYGPSAEKPDMEDHVFNLEKERHMEILQDWQNNRKKIEKESREQAKSQKWQMYRSKLLTASNFGKVCRRLKKTPCGNLVKSLLYPKVLDLPSIEHGRQCEDIAQEELSRKEGITIRKCGLFIDASIPFLGASPDGVIDDDDGIVEIKCPKTAENISPEEAIKTVPAVRKIFVDDAGTAMNKNNCYFYQVQGQLHITQKKYCLFCVWTRKGLISLKIYRDDKFWQQEMQSKLSRFYIHCMLPEIVDSRHNMSMAIREPSDIERRKPIIISSRSLESLELPDAMSSGSTL